MSLELIVILVLAIFVVILFMRQQNKHQDLQTLKILQDTLQQGFQETRVQVKDALKDYAEDVGKRVTLLTNTTDLRLKEINQQVEKRLTEGFEKTTQTFGDVIKRLALIDAAQKKNY